MFPGVSATYDRPADADLVVDTSTESIESIVKRIFAILDERNLLSSTPLTASGDE